MKSLLCVFAALAGATVFGADSLKDYAGTYRCKEFMRVRPSLNQMHNVTVKVTPLSGSRVRLNWKEGSSSHEFTTTEFGNGITPGSFSYSTGGYPGNKVDLMTQLNERNLSISLNEGSNAIVAPRCTKKK